MKMWMDKTAEFAHDRELSGMMKTFIREQLMLDHPKLARSLRLALVRATSVRSSLLWSTRVPLLSHPTKIASVESSHYGAPLRRSQIFISLSLDTNITEHWTQGVSD